MIELRDLRSFEILAAELHFGRAAQRLGVSPSTLTRRIRGLEHELATPLLIRTSRRVTLTEPGRELAARLPHALRRLDAALAATRTSGEAEWEV